MIEDRGSYQPLPIDDLDLALNKTIQPLPKSLYEQTTPLKERVVKVIDDWDSRLDKAITQNLLQKKLDQIGNYIEEKFKNLVNFLAGLDKKEFKAWYKDLAFYLIKLPAKVAFNIINLLYSLIKAICYTLTHPLKTPLKIAKILIELVHALTKPEVWTRMGAGAMGAALGQALFVLNPMATLIGLIIGSAMVFAGLSFGVLEAALTTEKGKRANKMKECLFLHAKAAMELGLTGFVMGVMMGAIQKAIQIKKPRALNEAELKEEAQIFIKKNNLPDPSYMDVTPSTQNIHLEWSERSDLSNLIFRHRGFPFPASSKVGAILQKVDLYFHGNNDAVLSFTHFYPDYFKHYHGAIPYYTGTGTTKITALMAKSAGWENLVTDPFSPHFSIVSSPTELTTSLVTTIPAVPVLNNEIQSDNPKEIEQAEEMPEEIE